MRPLVCLIQIKLGWALFVTYTIIQSIMRSEMCSLHLTHPSVHTWSSGQPTVQRPGSSRGLPAGARIRIRVGAGHRPSRTDVAYPCYKLLSQYFCYLNVCNTEIVMCGWKERLCCSFWISSSMNADLNVFNTCFTSRVSGQLEQRMFCRRPYQWMTAFTSEAWWWPILWFINVGSYKTCFSCSTDTRDVKQT